MTALAVNMNDHTLAVDIGDLEMTQFGPAQSGRVEGHQHGAMHQVPSRINQPTHLIRAEYNRQLPRALGKRDLIGQIRSPKGLDEEKPQSRRTALDGPGRQLPIAKQMNLILMDVAWAKALGRAMEVLRKIFHRVDISGWSFLWGVWTLGLIQASLPKVGSG